MGKKQKSGIVLTSLAAIAVAGSLIAGSTYALFTSEAKTNIAITSGKVSVSATISDLTAYTPKSIALDGTVVDDGNLATQVTANEEWTLGNGGSVKLDGETLSLSKMTPGDKVTFKIVVTNNSNVSAKYRTVVTKDSDGGLFNGLEIKINEEDFLGYDLTSSYADLGAEGTTREVEVEVSLPSDRGNVYQDKECKLIFAVEAVQGNIFDNTYEVTSANIQDYLDGKHGSLNGATLVLTDDVESVYPKLELGRPAAVDTDYYIDGYVEANKKSYADFMAYYDAGNTDVPSYIRNISNLTLKVKEGDTVSVPGLSAGAGHVYSSGAFVAHDYVLDTDTQYYLAQNWRNVTFDGLTFTEQVNIDSSMSVTSMNGVIFKNCKFDIGDTETVSANTALRFYNGCFDYQMKNLVVYNCEFNEFYQGILTYNIYGVSSIKNKFTSASHNAIAIQQSDYREEYHLSHGNVIIKQNSFDHINERLIKFAYVLSDTRIVIVNNVNTNPKVLDDGTIEVAKASSLADGIAYDIYGNDWGGTMADENNGAFLDR